MTEAARSVIDFGFERLDAKEISACHATWNQASRRVLQKIGMMFLRHLPQAFEKRGEWVAEDCYSISRFRFDLEAAKHQVILTSERPTGKSATP